MTEDLTSMAFSGSLTDPEEIDWQFSLGRTSLDPVVGGKFNGMSAVEACLALLCELHAAEMDEPTPTEERSLRMLVEDALGSTDFQTRLLPSLVARAIEADNSALVEILLPYAEDEQKVLALANGKDANDKDAARQDATSVEPGDEDAGRAKDGAASKSTPSRGA